MITEDARESPRDDMTVNRFAHPGSFGVTDDALAR